METGGQQSSAGGRRHASLTGRLLVAAPTLHDPNFHRTVVLLLDHDEDGAIGIVLNRPTVIDLDEVMPGWERLAAAPAVVHEGGPVEPGAVVGVGLSRTPPPEDGWIPIVGDLRAVDPTGDPVDAVLEVAEVRFFAGYAGWGPGQLETELAEDAWFVVDAIDLDAFTSDPAALWHDVLARQRGRLALLATFPEDPSLN
ncbi:MAG: YqgE/AlgH family protein [Actinomycetes bacterium]